MAPFRPSNLNKREYPGNANVIGPTTKATIGFSTTTCFSSTNFCSACIDTTTPILGCCTASNTCACPCCDVCCSCLCTICTRTIPSGMWSNFEAYEARTRDAWGNDTCSSSAATCLCCTNVGLTCTTTGGTTDYKAYYICCQTSPCPLKWFVAPVSVEVSECWKTEVCDSTSWCSIACANSTLGECGWFIPTRCQFPDPGYCCRTYWDDITTNTWWTSTDGGNNRYAFKVNFTNARFAAGTANAFGDGPYRRTNSLGTRPFRTVT